MRDPKLTVLTTVYNRERYLDQTIESILAQDFTDFEYVIVDDGSTDGTPEILQRWAARDPRILVERMPRNAGVSRALNRGLAVARGEYIGKQDSDDICLGSRLRAQVEVLDREQDVVHVSANFTLIDVHDHWAGDRRVENPSGLFPFLLNFYNADAGAGCQGMFRRNTALELGGFCEELEASVDYEFLTRLVNRGRFVILPITGSIKRMHPGQISVRLQQIQRRNSLANSRRMLTAYLARDLSDEEFLSVESIWPQGGWAVDAACANRVLREAYARFAAAEPDRNCRWQARRITAGRWALSAMMLLRRGAFREAASHLGYALQWHPLGLTAAFSSLREQLLLRAYRKFRPDDSLPTASMPAAKTGDALCMGLGSVKRRGSAEHIEHTGSSSRARN